MTGCDVLVIDGVPNISNMGGNSAQTGKRQGEAGAIVQGGIRDVPHQRSVGYPIWASDITPVTGPARMLAVTEAIAGTFYVAILISRLVAIHSSRRTGQ